MITSILLRRGTTTEWSRVNPVLKSGEPGFDVDTGQLKIGDGTTPWLELRSLPTYAEVEALVREGAPATQSPHLTFPTIASRRQLPSFAKYDAWPFACLIFDATRGLVAQAFTSGLAHALPDGRAQKVARILVWSPDDPSAVRDHILCDRTQQGLDSEVNSLGIAPNGDWVALARSSRNTTAGVPDVYESLRSQDGGTSWASDGPIIASGREFRPQQAAGWFTTSSGTTLTGAWRADGALQILRNETSSVDATNWTLHGSEGPDSVILPSAQAQLEPAFCELPDRSIIMLFRSGVDSRYGERRMAQFSRSIDDGRSWTWATDSDVSMNNNCCVIFLDPQTGMIEVISGDRTPSVDGRGSLWRYQASPQSARSGVFGPPSRLLAASGSHKDFGYPALVVTNTGSALLHWYDRTDGQADTAGLYQITALR